jgi:predicted nucleotidyltransferase
MKLSRPGGGESMDAILKRLQEEKDLGRRRLLLVGFLSSALKDTDAKPVVVGGQAVEIYTMGDYTTNDLDLVTPHRNQVGEALESLGFTKASGARHWINEELDLAVEIPDSKLAGSQDLLLEVAIEEFAVFVIGFEDLIIDRLNAFVHWKSVSDYEQALKIYLNHHQDLDQKYLGKQAKANMVEDGLRKLRSDGLKYSSS